MRAKRQAEAAPVRQESWPIAFALALAAAIVPFGAYLATLHPGLPAGDSGELITVAATFGVAHPPGYPLWTMLGGLWARALTVGTVAWRLNLFSAVAMAGAAALLALAVRRVSGSRVAAVVAAWAFAFATPACKYALVAEVFALNALLAAAVLLVLAHAVTARRGERAGTVGALAFLCALALSHHQTLLLLAIPAWAAAFAFASGDPAPVTRPVRALPISAAWALFGLLPLAWLALAPRHAPALAWGDTTSVQGFFSILLRAEYGTFRLDPLQAGMKADTSHVLLFARALPRDFGPLPLVLAAVGAAAAWARSRALALALAGFAVLQAGFFTRVGFPSDVVWLRGVIERFYILPILVLAFLSGLGAAWVLARLAARRALHAGLAVLLLATLFALPWAERSRGLDQRGNVFVETLGRGILASLPPRTVLFVQGDLLHNALAYLTLVERERPDVVVLDQELMTYPWYVRRARAAHPDVLPPLGRAEHVTLADGRVVTGIAIARRDGTVDVLTENGQVTLPGRDVADVAPAAAESMFAAARAGFRTSALLEESEDRYSGLPGTRNLLWLDHLAGKRPAAFMGVKDESYSLRYELAPAGFVLLAHPHGEAPAPAVEAAHALEVLEHVPLEPWFRAYDPTSFEAAERWRFASFATRTMLLCSRPEAAEAIRANAGGHERLLEFARRFEPLEPTPDPACLRAVAFLRVFDPAFRDLIAARRDFERYAASGAAAAHDAEVRDMLARLPAGDAR